MSDAESDELLDKLRDQRETALAEYFMEHRDRLHRMVARRLDQRLSKRVDASDILQEGFVDASRRLNDYLDKPNMPLFLWLRFLVKQRILAAYRWHAGVEKRAVKKEESADAAWGDGDSEVLANNFVAHMTPPSQAFARAEMRLRMRQLIDGLDPMDREIIVLRHIEQLSNSEAAAELGLSPSTASKRYIRALERLRNETSSVLEAFEQHSRDKHDQFGL